MLIASVVQDNLLNVPTLPLSIPLDGAKNYLCNLDTVLNR